MNTIDESPSGAYKMDTGNVRIRNPSLHPSHPSRGLLGAKGGEQKDIRLGRSPRRGGPTCGAVNGKYYAKPLICQKKGAMNFDGVGSVELGSPPAPPAARLLSGDCWWG